MTEVRSESGRPDVRAAVVEAAARLLREHGVAGVTTRAVAQAAGVQAPTIYRHFGDKDGLVDAVAEHVMAGYAARESAAADDGDPVADLRAAWDAHVGFGLANPELYGLFSAPARSAVSPATAAGIAVLRARVRRLAAAGLLRVDERRAVAMVHAAGTGTVLALLGMPADARDAGLAEAMFEALAGGMLASAPPVADAGTRTVAVALAARVPDLPELTGAERALLAEWLARSIAAL
ncbi:TetR/AcrR family transcriptional regulator [Geodermatophilus nigrescens]